MGCGALHTPGFLSATLSLDYRTPKTQPFLLHGDTQTHNFEGISPLWPPLLGKEMKLFFFTSLKTLSPRFNSVLGYRGQVQLQYHSGDIKFWGILCHEPGTKIKCISSYTTPCRKLQLNISLFLYNFLVSVFPEVNNCLSLVCLFGFHRFSTININPPHSFKPPDVLLFLSSWKSISGAF